MVVVEVRMFLAKKQVQIRDREIIYIPEPLLAGIDAL